MTLFEKITDILSTELAEYIADNLGVNSNEVSKIILEYLESQATPSPRSLKTTVSGQKRKKTLKKC